MGSVPQCIDRRFAAYATECDSADDGSGYAFDFINESVSNGETKTGIIDYLRQARKFLHANIDNFQADLATELADAVDESQNEIEQVEAIHALCQRHGSQIQRAAHRMVEPLGDYPDGSLRTLLYQTDLTRPPAYLLAHQIAAEVKEFVRRAFAAVKPANEPDLNAKIDAFLSTHRERFRNEHPCLSFSTARIVPDHSKIYQGCNLSE